MSKITSKNLSYDSTLPPFLARLQANNNSRDDRHEFAIARPKKARTAEDEAEDEPVYFNEESGETLTKGEWEAREAGNDEEKADEKDAAHTLSKEDPESLKAGKKEEKVAAIGVGKKRKVGKIVGGEEDDEPIAEEKKAPKREGKKVEKGKSAKKAKKVKLSFGDDE
ncbi:uncharacterized protein LY89DRAFT_681205 [Mollisia scopiformis]|uniref:DUF4604 domain-containing protein n=1 Tax=Mollisia scopiformis TaxID=149040 RepID=A0A194XNS4_MOLSC|nr:uncharacterized protein LY89DRAFT_681205 [Mollisia scopiformis]KUJ21811.1 hypothetical protein LY89DRAFT_681205 [Mollisia scopiformis]